MTPDEAFARTPGPAELLDSVVAQRADDSLVIGRGVPNAWVADGEPFGVTNFPISGGRRIGVQVSERGLAVTLRLTGPASQPIDGDRLPADTTAWILD